MSRHNAKGYLLISQPRHLPGRSSTRATRLHLCGGSFVCRSFISLLFHRQFGATSSGPGGYESGRRPEMGQQESVSESLAAADVRLGPRASRETLFMTRHCKAMSCSGVEFRRIVGWL